MPSDEAPRRLHPATIFFDLLGYIRAFAVPAVLLFFGYGGSDDPWRLWGAVLVVPAGLAAVAQYLSFTYTYGRDELIVRSGIFFRKERHVPYSRIQNIDANQGILHRILRVYNLTLESGSGAEPEATLSVLPEGALAEMRRRVFEERGERAHAKEPVNAEAEPADRPSTVLLDLGLRDLVLCGLIRGRGLLLLAGIFGLISQWGLDEQAVNDATPEEPELGWIASALKSMYEGMSFDLGQLLLWMVLFTVVVLLLRLLSTLQTIVMFYGFRMTLADDDLRLSYGLLTHVKATIPLRRIQTITIREGPLHRRFGVSSVRAATAGGMGPQMPGAGSRDLAPILPRGDVAPLVRVLMPEADLDALGWQPAHPRAFRRLLVRRTVRALVLTAAVSWFAGVWTVPIAAALLAAGFADAKLHARHMAHSLSDGVFAFRSGWFMRQTTITPLRKVQATGLVESPFDRHHGMAALVVDTAGAGGAPHDLHVPYLDRARAHALSAVIASRAMEAA
ncbi:MAG TPA: PH domain-containing protein [Vicinamibacterales bacterium]|nr:PH domain-containing protein [Vicinamibacterales bacterium]